MRDFIILKLTYCENPVTKIEFHPDFYAMTADFENWGQSFMNCNRKAIGMQKMTFSEAHMSHKFSTPISYYKSSNFTSAKSTRCYSDAICS